MFPALTVFEALLGADAPPDQVGLPCLHLATLSIENRRRVVCDDLDGLLAPTAAAESVFLPRDVGWMEWPDQTWPGHRVGVAMHSVPIVSAADPDERAAPERKGATTVLSLVFFTLDCETTAVGPLGLPGAIWATVFLDAEGRVVSHVVRGGSEDEVVTADAQCFFSLKYVAPALDMISLMCAPEDRLVDHRRDGLLYTTVEMPGVLYGPDGMAIGGQI